MKKADVIQYFGSITAAANALNIKQPSVSNWDEYPPANRQMQIQFITGGKLRAEPWAIDEVLGVKNKDAE